MSKLAGDGTVARSKMPWSVALALFALWAVLSGKMDAFHLGVGALSVALLVWLQAKLPAFRKPGDSELAFVGSFLYVLWLLWQMLVSAWQVAGWILGPQSRVSPRMFRFRCKMPSEVHAVVFANSITLTPGTLTVDLEGDDFLVHALMPDTESDVLNGDMARRVARLGGSGAEITIEPLPLVKQGGSER